MTGGPGAVLGAAAAGGAVFVLARAGSTSDRRARRAALALLATGLRSGVVARAWPLPGRLPLRRRPPAGAEEALDEVLGTMTSVLAGGGSLLQAVEIAATGPGGHQVGLAAVVGAVGRGRPLLSALDAWAAGPPAVGADLGPRRLVADAVAIAATTGASHTEAVAGVRRTLQARAAVQREIRAVAAPARTSAAAVVAAPVAFAVLVVLVDPSVRAFLLLQPAGWGCLAASALLDALGAAWMARQVRSVR